MEMLNAINWLDLAVLLLVIRGLYLGIRNGLSTEIFRFIGAILSLTFAIHSYSQIAEIFIANFALPAWLSQFLCFVVIAQLIRIIFKYGIILLLKILNIQFMPPLEKPGGAVVGLARAVIVAGALILMLSFFPSKYMTESIYDKSFSGAFLAKAMQRTYQSLTFWLPEERIEEAIFKMPTPNRKAIAKRKK